VDFYELDPLLTDDERQIRDHVRGWVEDRYLPIVEQAYEEAHFPMEVVPELAAMGMFGATLPEEFGGAGVSHTAYGLAMQELERGDSGLRSFVSVQGALCMYPIFAFGSDEQRRHWLPPMARGASGSPSPTSARTPAG
jgi:glutaryl-CoA dehydrogenase